MPYDQALDRPRSGSDWIAPDCAGMDFHAADPGLRDLLAIYLPADVLAHLTPHYQRLGRLAGGRLDELARTADRHPPVLHARDRFGRDQDWIEYHPAYREMEQIAFGDFQFHAMSHRGGMLGMDRPLPPVAKYAFQYLFVQGEFGLMCPISVTDTSIHLIRKFGSNSLQDYLLPKMLSADLSTMWKGTQFMTEKAGGSDVGAIETVAREQDGVWRLYGDKWFCSHTDADVALMLARPEGAVAGTRGLALFALPRRTRDGSRNAYRIARLKDKLGTKSMASGEILLEGAEAYLVGQPGQGLKQMMEQVNLSRLSHGVRAAAMMRRCVNEALAASRGRVAFGRTVADFPLMRRQLMKMLVPAEQALSMALCTADALGRGAREELRILTGLLKLRACRDNVIVATAAMEARGGNGYIEDWVNPRLIRDAQVGLLWEGTSNINALDVIQRAVGKAGAHRALQAMLRERLAAASALPAEFKAALGEALDRAMALAERVAGDGRETLARQAATALYDVASAVLLAWEGSRPGADARRVLVARFVLAHRLSPADPLAPEEAAWERPATDALLGERRFALQEAAALLV
ncbi:MAG TPA: acyl-CoA dehydrogenase family protein [Rhodopila sp.]|nr:acyl-CoA dehydrogenase family protein [Rhodopila sp.]